MNTRTIVIAVAAVVAVVLGLWAFKQQSDRSEVAALVRDTGARLRETLAIEAGPAGTIGPEAVQKLEGHAAAAERNREALKRIGAAGKESLVDAADSYLVTGQEIMRRQAAAHGNRLQLAASLQALRDHFRADRGARTWVREAVKLREPVEKHYVGYRSAAEIMDKLLESLPASQSRIAPLVGGMPLAESNLMADARKRSQETLKRATDEVERLKQPAAR